MGKLKVVIDRIKCEGIGPCADETDLIELDKRHKAVFLEPGKNKEELFKELEEKKKQEVIIEVPIDKEEEIFRAAEACPVDAIIIYDAETGEQLYP
jgi:ferredoxin